MHEAGRRIALAVLLLSALWIAVYWWWPAEPPIRFASAAPREAAGDQTPSKPDPSPQTDPLPQPKPDPQPPAVIPPEFFDHTVQAGETFESISKRYFGTTAHGEAIARSNPFVDPGRLKAGRVVRVPRDPGNIQGILTKPETPAPPPPSAPAEHSYTVKPGDSLSRIAKEMYGEASLARLIFDANRDVLKDEDSLSVGQKLRIPPKPKS